jgi:Mn-dependent DtxR family transcriptional regulator
MKNTLEKIPENYKNYVKEKYLIDLDKVNQLLKDKLSINEIAEKLGVKSETLIATLYQLKKIKI